MFEKSYIKHKILSKSIKDHNEKKAARDIEYIERLSDDTNILFRLYQESKSKRNQFKLKIYTLGEKIQLYKIMPLIDSMGFLAVDENVFQIDVKKSNQQIWIQDFSLYVEDRVTYNIDDIKHKIQDAFCTIFLNKLKNGALNQLILRAGIAWREVFLLNAYCKYLLQIKFEYSQGFIKSALVQNSASVKLIIQLFYCNFAPNHGTKEAADTIRNKIKTNLTRIINRSEYRVVKKLLELIDNTLRTNYFQTSSDGTYKDYISFKFNSSAIEDMPLPKPCAEIFVYSSRVEGIHLRGGKISRGGLRWSDRIEDYRTEVLSLMKAQVTKNSIIVPEGSKGGFLVQNADTFKTREEFTTEGIECYKTFLRGMLDITDNFVKGKIVKPKNTVCFDGDDPYLVIAADKGTASFSDTANKIAGEYNFWLGDAFASGGAAGYDHKKMGITSRGAWISVIEHFKHLNIDPSKQTFTVVGIGDMSGDVFGNGLLLSNKIKLIAAFNHIHIFIDPNPDSSISYKERKRLFKLSKSNWSDYNSKLISKGGAIFCRHAKVVKLSKEIKTLLNVKQNSMEPDCLIRHILKCKADLLWNGGIGTYVKAETELNEQIGNKSNDNVRVNAKDLNFAVVAEGGNLGFTQLGRVEYAFNGGLINTDFIDNSAGVDCSDHEVNIKIALDSAVMTKKLTKSERDKFLLTMQSEVSELVLKDNYMQTQNISVSASHTVESFESYVKLIEVLKETVDLDPVLEFLPNKMELSRRNQEKIGFSRPELSVLMAYGKRAVYKDLINSALPDDSFYKKFLISYFPSKMQTRFKDEILNHGLNREIITTSVANDLVNNTGIEFFHLAQNYTGLNGCDIVRAYSIVRHIFDLAKIESQILDIKNNEIRIEAFCTIRTFLQTAIYWFLRNKPHPLKVLNTIEEFSKGAATLMNKIDNFIRGSIKKEYKDKADYFVKKGVDSTVALKISKLKSLYSSMDIIVIANKTHTLLEEVAKIYFDLGERFYYNWLREKVDCLPRVGYWEKMLIKSLKDDIYDQQRELATKVAMTTVNQGEKKIDVWSAKHGREIRAFYEFIDSVRSMEDIGSAKLVVAIKQGNILINQ